jgi:hypothetical protein
MGYFILVIWCEIFEEFLIQFSRLRFERNEFLFKVFNIGKGYFRDIQIIHIRLQQINWFFLGH